MIDFATLDPAVIVARGQYATVRSEHEDAKKRTAMQCSLLSTTSAQILRAVQPDNDAVLDLADIQTKIAACRVLVADIDASAVLIAALAEQRAALKAEAWARPAKQRKEPT